VFRSVAFAEGIVSAVCADCFELLCLGFRDVDKWVKESGEYYDLAWYSIAALKPMISIFQRRE
jgi:hypothetical protein